MKVYLAAPYSQMPLMREWAQKLEAAGHTCTSQWIRGHEEGMSLHNAAMMDLEDIDEADAVVSMVLPKGTMFSGGGRHVELGYGIAKGKLMIIISDEAENIFHELHTIMRCTTIDDAVAYLS